MDIRELIKGYKLVILSIVSDEYPISIPIKKFGAVNDKITLARPKGLDMDVSQKAYLLFHTHDKLCEKHQIYKN